MKIDTDPHREIETYCLAKILSECGELAHVAGNAICFGIDTPDQGKTGRARIEEEFGDVNAAISFAVMHRVVFAETVNQRTRKKLRKLLDPDQRDNLGRPLALQPLGRSSGALSGRQYERQTR